jgi:hypothetical protein
MAFGSLLRQLLICVSAACGGVGSLGTWKFHDRLLHGLMYLERAVAASNLLGYHICDWSLTGSNFARRGRARKA